MLAYLHIIDEKVRVMDPLLKVNAPEKFRENPDHEEGKISDVPVYLPFPLRRTGIQQNVSFQEHARHILKPLPHDIFNLIESVDMRKLGQKIGYIVGDIDIAPFQFLNKGLFG